MLRIPVVKGNINRALKEFKRKFKRTGRLKEIRERKYYMKPSLANHIKKDKAVLTRKYREDNDE